MKRSIFTTFFILCLGFTTMGQSQVEVSGTMHDGFGGTLSGKLVKYQLWAFDSLKNYIDSAKGSLVSGGSGLIAQNISVSPATRSGLVRLSYMNCDSVFVQLTDTFSKLDSMVNFSMFACGIPKIVVTGRMMFSNGTPATGVKVYWYTDSLNSAKHNYSLMKDDTTVTDSGGYFTDIIYLKTHWYYGEIDAIFGCTTQNIVHKSYYADGYTFTANVNIGTRTYCNISSPRALFAGVIRDQNTGQPLPGYTFYIKIDSVNTAGDSAIRTVTTRSDGSYVDSVALSGINTVRYSLRLPNCGSLKVLSGTAATTFGSSNVYRSDSMCGSYDWNAQFMAVIQRVTGSASYVNVLVKMYDTLGNPIDTFHRQWYSNGYYSDVVDVDEQYKAVDLEIVYQGCLGQVTTSQVRARITKPSVYFSGTYEYCNGNTTLDIYLNYSQPGVRWGTAYLIKMDTLTTGGVLDTLLTLVDSIAVDSGYYAHFQVPAGIYYAKFAPTNPADPFYNNMMATYYGKDSALYWGDADTIILTKNAWRFLKIRTGTNMGGPGFIGGSLSSGANKTGNPIGNVSIILLNVSMQPLKTTLTNNSGEYSFSNLPYGTYYVLVDVPGRKATPEQVVISSQTSSVTSANFVVHKKYVESKFNTGIKTVSQHKLKAVYPNPASSQVTLEFGVAGAYTVEIYTLQGQKVLETKVDGSKALLGTDGLSTGVYLVRALDTRTGTILLDRLNIDK